MKQILGFFRGIEHLPEEARKILAAASFILSVALVFGIWQASVSSRLATNRVVPAPAEEPQPSETSVFSPGRGIAESFRSLGAVIPNPTEGISGDAVRQGTANFFIELRNKITGAIDSLGNRVFNGIL